MPEISRIATVPAGLSDQEIADALSEWVAPMRGTIRRALLLPPDATRAFSGVGAIAAACYRLLSAFCQVDVMPALGTHQPMSDAEIIEMYQGAIAPESVLVHDWRRDLVTLGAVPADFVSQASHGAVREAIEVQVNARLLDPAYDLILSLGQVVPHEVAGMANYSKNILVGCGGAETIHMSHLLGAAWGIRRTLGVAESPVRAVFDYAQQHFLSGLPLHYLMTVSAPRDGVNRIHGLYIGRNRAQFAAAAQHSARLNITRVARPARKVVALMDERAYKTCWVANKAIYRTCMAIEPGGELLIIAPGVRRFGEDDENDALIRRYGFRGTRAVLDALAAEPALRQNKSVAAHLMHGSPDGQFTVTYATDRLDASELESVGYGHISVAEAMRYLPGDSRDGIYPDPDGGEYLFIAHAGAGLWMADPDQAQQTQK